MVGFGAQILCIPNAFGVIEKKTNEQRDLNESFANQGDELTQEDNELLDELIKRHKAKEAEEDKKE